MPFYEYVCQDCGHGFEQLVRSMSGKPKVTCSSCGSKKTVQQLSVFSAQTAGSPSSLSQPSGSCGTCSDGSCPYAGG
jgi:putative FmdB family regulatory protein